MPPGKRRHVLLVDAETYVWEVVRHCLGDGYRTSAAATRHKGIRILQDDAPDVMIVDVMLSEAFGLPFAFHGLHRQIPIVMVTTNHVLARRAARLGCAILRKPYSPSELREFVDDAADNPDNNLAGHRKALERIRIDRREREAVLRLLAGAREGVRMTSRLSDC